MFEIIDCLSSRGDPSVVLTGPAPNCELKTLDPWKSDFKLYLSGEGRYMRSLSRKISGLSTPNVVRTALCYTLPMSFKVS